MKSIPDLVYICNICHVIIRLLFIVPKYTHILRFCPLVQCTLTINSHCSALHPLQGGWTGVLAAARYGHAEVLRELVTKYGCDKNATKRVG